MSVISKNNVTPRETLTREDLQKIIRDEVGQVKAEIITETRDRAQHDQENPDKAKALANKARETAPKARVRSKDNLATKDVEELDSHDRARMFARSLQAMFQARQEGGGVELAAAICERAGQHTLSKAFQATDFDQGGFMVEPAFAEGVIEELLAKSVYMRAGPQTVDMPEGGLIMPYENDGADAQWIGEGTAASAEEVTGGQLRLQPHKLITIVGISNDLLRSQVGRSDQFVLNSIIRGMRTKLDSTLLRSLGVSSEPMGLRGLVKSANQFDVTSTATITQAVLVREVLKLQNLIETGNVDMSTDNPYYFTSPRIKNYLKAQRATDGVLFPEMSEGKLLGVPFDTTSNIPVNLDESGSAANDESELYCVALAHMILGKTEDMVVDVAPGAAYTNSSGSTVAGFSRDETPVRVIGKWDHAAGQRGAEIAMAQELDWAL